MLVSLLLLFASAFPVRGSVVRSLDSNLVIDGDTVHVRKENCPCLCPAFSYVVPLANTVNPNALAFVGATSSHVTLAGMGGKFLGMDASGMIPRCSTSASVTDVENRRLRLRGKTGIWGVWADSILLPGTRYGSSVSLGYSARWRWSRIDTTLAWVRWIDTIALRPGLSWRDVPVLTTWRAVVLDSLRPESNGTGLGLLLRTGPDSLPLDWGYRVPGKGSGTPRPLVYLPTESIPANRTFRVEDAFQANGGAARWIFASGQATVDFVTVTGQGTSGQIPTPRAAAAIGSRAYDLTSGRRVVLERPLAVGGHLVDGPGGMRPIVVK